MKPVSVIGHVDIRTLAQLEDAMQEMRAVLAEPIDGLNIICTNQKRLPEPYGWQSPIAEHVDGCGYSFFMPIFIEDHDTLKVGDDEVELKVGDVILFDDRLKHETTGKGDVLALFFGSYRDIEINDDLLKYVVESFSKLVTN